MKTAKELMLEYTAYSFRDPKKAAEIFAEDGAFELPYEHYAECSRATKIVLRSHSRAC